MSQIKYVRTCTHDGAAPVLQIGKCTIVAGSAWDVNDALEELQPTYLISVGGRDLNQTAKEEMVSYDPATKAAFKNAYALTPKRHKVKGSIIVDWPDMGAPPMDREWWDALYLDLSKIDGTVAVFCMGGHGRTGTTMTILAALGGVAGAQDPVEWVRDNWCFDAVESDAQIKYLRGLGIHTNAKPSKDHSKGMAQYQIGPGLNNFGDLGLDPEEALTALMVGADEAHKKKSDCDVCLESGAKYDEEERLWLCSPCKRDAKFVREGKTEEDDAQEADPNDKFCVDCNSSPAFWDQTWKDFFCNGCMNVPNVPKV